MVRVCCCSQYGWLDCLRRKIVADFPRLGVPVVDLIYTSAAAPVSVVTHPGRQKLCDSARSSLRVLSLLWTRPRFIFPATWSAWSGRMAVASRMSSMRSAGSWARLRPGTCVATPWRTSYSAAQARGSRSAQPPSSCFSIIRTAPSVASTRVMRRSRSVAWSVATVFRSTF